MGERREDCFEWIPGIGINFSDISLCSTNYAWFFHSSNELIVKSLNTNLLIDCFSFGIRLVGALCHFRYVPLIVLNSCLENGTDARFKGPGVWSRRCHFQRPDGEHRVVFQSSR